MKGNMTVGAGVCVWCLAGLSPAAQHAGEGHVAQGPPGVRAQQPRGAAGRQGARVGGDRRCSGARWGGPLLGVLSSIGRGLEGRQG